jgi:predicted anti-sigma-YlaC factor YlaD
VSHHAHLAEERLLDHYLAARDGDLLDPPVAEHLADCRACGARYADLASFMDTLRADGVAEADAIFTADRLRAQQQQIARRLEQVGRPARVLSFPGQVVRRTMGGSSARTAPRWIAAAAAAGLFVGVVVGASYNSGFRSRIRETARQTVSTPLVAPIATRGSAPAQVASDAAFLSDLELALERPHTRELLAFDALTPHVREVSTR